jgi:hypothetical protein
MIQQSSYSILILRKYNKHYIGTLSITCEFVDEMSIVRKQLNESTAQPTSTESSHASWPILAFVLAADPPLA